MSDKPPDGRYRPPPSRDGLARRPSWPALALAGLGACAGVAQAEGPVRGNPLDSLPTLERPAPPPPPPARIATPGSAQAAVQARLQQRITPRHFDVQGSTAIPFEQITALLTPLAGQEMTVATLVQQVDRITALYQQAGYLLSFALLQNQDFAEGRVRVTVVEGHVSALRLEGDVGGGASSRLHALAAPLLAEKPLTRPTLERVLNLMRTVPGVRFATQLELPRRADGATELVLQASHRRAGLSGGIADLGTGQQGVVNLTANSLTSLGEQLKLSAALPTAARSVRYFSGTLTLPLGNDGLALEIDGHHYRSQPRDRALEAQGWERQVTSERVGAALSYPVLLDNARLLSVSGGLYAVESADQYHRKADNAWLRQEARLRVARVGLKYRQTSERQSREINFNIHKGLNGLGASQRLRSNYGATGTPGYDLDFLRYTLNVEQTVKLPAGFGLKLSAAGQYSRHRLPSSEQISFGAWRYGLGYPQGDIAGDKGYGVSLEVNRHFRADWRWLRMIQPYVAVDHARAWSNQDSPLQAPSRRLSSVAAGLRLSDDRYYLLDVNVAKPVGDSPQHGRGRGVRVNANYSLFYDAL